MTGLHAENLETSRTLNDSNSRIYESEENYYEKVNRNVRIDGPGQ